MFIKSANFISSCPSYKECPDTIKPEYAFIGRSNVGKSSLINYITGNSKLAKTSGTPGKTQLLNYFSINDAWYIVDLPGYGYAKVSKKLRVKFERMIKDYLALRENLWCIFLLIDSRVPPQKIDLELINWMGGGGLPFSIVFTKADKQKKSNANIEAFKSKLLENWEELPPMFLTSAAKKEGAEELLTYIEQQNELVAKRNEQML